MSSTRTSLFGQNEPLTETMQAAAGKASAASDARVASHGLVLRDDSLQVVTRLMAAFAADERVIVVTSCDPKDGASDLAAQLALGLSRTTQEPAALVDSDVRRPSLGPLFGVTGGPGFAELAEGTAELSAVSRESDGLFFIPAGTGETVLAVPSCVRAIAALRARFRYIVIAAAPVLEEASAVTLASLADGVVLSLRAGKRRRGEVESVQRELARVRARFLGAVLRNK